MAATQSSDVNFVPKVWTDHTQAYVDEKLGIAQLAVIDKTLESRPGETVVFPFFKQIGDIPDVAEDEGLQIDRLTDGEYSVMIKECGKGVGWTDKALRKSASPAEFMKEAQSQLAYKFSKKLDDDCLAVLQDNANSVEGKAYPTVNTDVATVSGILAAKIGGFGDHAEDAVAIIMHSQTFLTIVTDAAAGFLKADAIDPFFNRPGFMGRLFGMALFVNDRIAKKGAGIGGNAVRPVYMTKANPYGIFMAQDMRPEMDRDIVQRETLVTATMWYGVLSLSKRVSDDDVRIVRAEFATKEAA